MADGKAKRWNGDKPKHLVEINDEPILKRTCRLFENCTISSHNPDYNFAPRYEPQNNVYEIDRFLSNEPIWGEETLFLYGDVYYTEEAQKVINNTPTTSITFFGRKRGNQVKRYGEIFAVKVKTHNIFKEKCLEIRGLEKQGKARGLAWDVFRRLGRKNFIELPDGCEDFDKIEDLENFKKHYDFSQ